MKNPVYLHSFEPVLPLYHLPQAEIIDWTMKSHQRAEELSGSETVSRFEVLKKFCVSPSQIHERYFECPDVNLNWDTHEIYKISQSDPMGKDIYERNEFFSKRATLVMEKMYQDKKVPDHLIHVTCTGYVSPSPAQNYFSDKASRPDITHAYHMGCYASLPAIRMASAFVGSGEDRAVDVVHTEMCSLHLNPLANTPEQMVVQSLFADGHIKYSAGLKPEGLSLKVLTIKEQLIPESLDDMTWIPSSHGMKMTLSRNVPPKIGEALKGFVEAMCAEVGIDFEDVRRNGIFAIHPGGPKIIESVGEKLDLTKVQTEDSFKVLRERGNMSSATLPHVWLEILKKNPASGTKVLSLAFGPGLTIFGGIFEVQR